MKIAIVTLVGNHNYGNVLQAYALQTTLRRMGHDVTIINREANYPSCKLFCLRLLSIIKCAYRRYICGNRNYIICNPLSAHYQPQKNKEKDCSNIKAFSDKYLKRSAAIRSNKALERHARKSKYECYIVGSDQVWRELYTTDITDSFLKFLPKDCTALKVAYAASFGQDTDFISPEHLDECIELAKRFDKISVREESGVTVMSEVFNLPAKHVLDPTLLLDTESYKKLITENPHKQDTKGLVTYILDSTTEKQEAIRNFANRLNLLYTPIPYSLEELQPTLKVYSVYDWLYSIDNAKYVITDSFHGTVFCILFHKPFICIGNEGRGTSRFTSLLKIFHLEDRLVSSLEDFTDTPINWEEVDAILATKRAEAMEFLTTALNPMG